MARITGFDTREGVVAVVDITSLPEWPGGDLGAGSPVPPEWLDALPDEQVALARPEHDPAQPDRLARILHDDP